MPFYEYQCQECQHELERLQKISDEPLKECPECGKPALRKKISAAGFRLSGGGWYETDFKNSGTKKNLAGENSDKSDKKDSGSKDKKADTKTESAKPTKTESKGTSAKKD